LSSQAQAQGIGGLNALSGLGAQQQTLEQQKMNYPMTSLQNYANLMSGLNIPTGSTQSVTGPAGSGQLQTSAQNQILVLGTSGIALWNQPYQNKDGKSVTLGQSILDYFKGNQANSAIDVAGRPENISQDPIMNQGDYTPYIDPLEYERGFFQ
jgi:hypothetical protein